MKILSVVLAVALMGCSQKVVLITPAFDEETGEGMVREEPYGTATELSNVYFDFDRAVLRQDTLDSLKSNAEVLMSNTDKEFLVEGHCDERGSTGYNLGLGQLRAKAIRDYYMALGLDGRMIGTISYGEEQPVCEESNESCWEENRRGETKVR